MGYQLTYVVDSPLEFFTYVFPDDLYSPGKHTHGRKMIQGVKFDKHDIIFECMTDKNKRDVICKHDSTYGCQCQIQWCHHGDQC